MNKSSYTSILAAVLGCVATSRADLIAHYDFETDFSNKVADGSAGHGFNGALAGQAGGVEGNALTLAGGSNGAGLNDYFRTDTNYGGTASLTDAGANFTISVWYKLDNPWFNNSEPPGGRLFVFEGNTDFDVSYCIVGDSFGRAYANGGGNTIIPNAGTAGAWHSVITTYASVGGTTTVTIWVNGIKHPATLTPATAGFVGIDGINFGVHRAEDRAFDGQMDELKIWNNVLSDQEILDEYGLEPVQPPPPDLSMNLVGYYAFDEDFANAAGLSAPDGTSVNSAATIAAGGLVGGAMQLDDPAGNKHMNVAATFGSEGTVLGENFTVSAWYKLAAVPTANGSNRYFVFESQTGYDVSYGLRNNTALGDTSVYDAQSYTGNGQHTEHPDKGSPVWHNVVHTFAADASNTTVVTYIDGIVSGSAISNPNTSFNDTAINFGAPRNSVTNRGFDGFIDEVALWDRVLTAGEIAEVFSRGSDGQSLTGGPPISALLTVVHDPAADSTELTWKSSEGELFEIRKSLDLTGDPAGWQLVMTEIPAAAAPAETTTQVVDTNASEAAAFYKLFRIPPPPLFQDDFETDKGWIAGVNDANGNTLWERGAPGFPGPEGGAGGSDNCFGTNLTANYGFDANIYLRSPVIDLTAAGLTGAQLALQQLVDTDLSGDLGSIRILRSSDNLQLGAAIATGIEGADSDWGPFTGNLPPEALGEMIRIEFQFTSNNTTNFSGWYLDDVVVTGQ